MSSGRDTREVQVDWTTAAAIGDTLSVTADGGLDDRWIEAFKVVLDEHEFRAPDHGWAGIGFQWVTGDEEPALELLVREIEPDVGPAELREVLEGVVSAANTTALVGTHVYDLAQELRRPQADGPRGSVPPPSLDPLADELDADAA